MAGPRRSGAPTSRPSMSNGCGRAIYTAGVDLSTGAIISVVIAAIVPIFFFFVVIFNEDDE